MIQELLEQRTRNGIKDISFDTRHETIRIQLHDETSVQFEGVISFFFSDDFPSAHQGEGLAPIVYDAMGFMPVMDLSYYEEDLFETLEELEMEIDLFDDDFFEELPVMSHPNFSVSLGHTSLFIEAQKVRIGDQLYHLSSLPH